MVRSELDSERLDSEKEHHKGRIKDKDRPRDRERDFDRDRDDDDRLRDRDRDRNKERDKQRDREKERDREREKETNREKDKEKVKDRERDRGEKPKDKDREKERDKTRDKEASKPKDRDKDEKKKDRVKDRGEPGRDRDEKRKDKDRDREKEKDREREKEKDRARDRERDKESNRAKEREPEKETEDDRRREYDRVKDMEKERSAQEKPPQDTGSARKSDVHGKEKGEADNEIATWVAKSRKLEDQRKIEERVKAARTARLLAEQESREDSDSEDEDIAAHTGKDLSGLKVKHGLDVVMEGGAVVLTLKDRDILDGDDVNEELDELENIEIAQQQTRNEAYKAAKKKPGTYEDKFQNDINAVRTILPQYDEEMKDNGITLDETGGLNEEGRKKLDELRKKLQGVGQKNSESLDGVLKVASDFYTQEEMLLFNKPKKKKKLRKKDTLDIDALEAEAKAEGLGAADLGNRASGTARAMRQVEEKAAEESRKSAYSNAYSKAVDASKKLRGEIVTEVKDEDAVVFGAEEDDELYRSLQRARQAALKKQTENGVFTAGPQAVVAALEQASGIDMPMGAADDTAEKDKATVVFTDTEEFCRSLQLDEAIMRRPGVKDAFAGEDDERHTVLTGEEGLPGVDGGWREVKESSNLEPQEDNEEEDALVEQPIKEVAVGKGLAAALQILKERGTLKETVDWGGRNMDKRKSKLVNIADQDEKFRNREILLDRLDEFGRTMTPKESFRKLSHKFHGKGPGKMKQEKRMKQYEEEMKLKQMNSGDTPLMSMEKMREAQAKMHTPYIVISGHIKPGQTSDPRSGFATVEKESVGSLTPMLGDKKVEHFLGIKRKAEGGSMGPPPPRKPKYDR